MPNWCQNRLEITGPAEQIKRIAETGLKLTKLMPSPEEMEDSISGTLRILDQDVNEALLLIKKNNIAKYGAEDWYDWNRNNWGTKWEIDAELDVGPDYLTANFDSAWSPPLPVISILKDKFPGITIHYDFLEGGGAFAGTYRYNPEDGEQLNEINFNSSDELEDFGEKYNNLLADAEVESMREWEKEEQNEE